MAEAVAPSQKTAVDITVVVPEGAQSGNAVLHTASGGQVEVAVVTVKPESVAFNPNPAALAAPLSLSGRNMQHVVSVAFAGGTAVEVAAPQADGFSITVPATLPAGNCAVTLNLSNGETVDAGSVELTAPQCAYATVLPAEDAEILAGETFLITVANADKLTGVLVNGQPVQYILNGDRLIIQVPESAGKNSSFTLVSSNGEISYDIAFIPATHVENVIFTDVRDLGSWAGEDAGGAFRLYKDSFKGVPAGSKLVFHIAPYAFTQIQVNDANWGQIDILKPDMSATTAEFELTAEVLDRILTTNDGWSETAMVIQGEGTVVNKVHIEWENSLETVIWDKGWTAVGWEGNQDLAWGGYDWSSVKPGTVFRMYATRNVAEGEWWFLGLRHGQDWGELPGGAASQLDSPVDGKLELVLTREILDDIVANGGIVMVAGGCTVNKVTLE